MSIIKELTRKGNGKAWCWPVINWQDNAMCGAFVTMHDVSPQLSSNFVGLYARRVIAARMGVPFRHHALDDTTADILDYPLGTLGTIRDSYLICQDMRIPTNALQSHLMIVAVGLSKALGHTYIGNDAAIMSMINGPYGDELLAALETHEFMGSGAYVTIVPQFATGTLFSWVDLMIDDELVVIRMANRVSFFELGKQLLLIAAAEYEEKGHMIDKVTILNFHKGAKHTMDISSWSGADRLRLLDDLHG